MRLVEGRSSFKLIAASLSLLGLYFILFFRCCLRSHSSLSRIFRTPSSSFSFSSSFPTRLCLLSVIFLFSFGLLVLHLDSGMVYFVCFPSSPPLLFLVALPPFSFSIHAFPSSFPLGHTGLGFILAHFFQPSWQEGGHSRQAEPRRQKMT